MEKLGLIFSALIHDFDHPGVNNRYLINSRANKALLYNDISVLENHHAAASFIQLDNPANNFLVNLPPNDFNLFRKMVVDAVLATDLTLHFNFLTEIRRGLMEDINLQKEEFRHLIRKLIIKAADISNPTRPLDLAKRWAESFLEESFLQGDEEKKRSIAISPFSDRENPRIGHCQISFIDVLCRPLYAALNEFIEIDEIMVQLDVNRVYWETVKEQEIENDRRRHK